MANSINIPTGLKIPAQIPLDVKQFSVTETLLANLGTDNNLAYTYHDNLRIYCFEEETTYVWREVKTGEENTGLVSTDFIYPNNYIVFGVDYSNKRYNFFESVLITSENIDDYGGTGPQGPAGNDGNDGADGSDGTNGLNADMTRISLSTVTMNTGFRTFAFNVESDNLGWVTGMRLRFQPTGPGNIGVKYMEGYISSVFPTAVIAVIDYVVGFGTFSSWNIGVIGDPGAVQNLQKTITVTTDYTLLNSDHNYTIIIDNDDNDVEIIIPESLRDDFICFLKQKGTATIDIVPDTGSVNIYSPDDMITIRGQYAWACIEKDQNNTSINDFYLSGFLTL